LVGGQLHVLVDHLIDAVAHADRAALRLGRRLGGQVLLTQAGAGVCRPARQKHSDDEVAPEGAVHAPPPRRTEGARAPSSDSTPSSATCTWAGAAALCMTP